MRLAVPAMSEHLGSLDDTRPLWRKREFTALASTSTPPDFHPPLFQASVAIVAGVEQRSWMTSIAPVPLLVYCRGRVTVRHSNSWSGTSRCEVDIILSSRNAPGDLDHGRSVTHFYARACSELHQFIAKYTQRWAARLVQGMLQHGKRLRELPGGRDKLERTRLGKVAQTKPKVRLWLRPTACPGCSLALSKRGTAATRFIARAQRLQELDTITNVKGLSRTPQHHAKRKGLRSVHHDGDSISPGQHLIAETIS